MAEVYTTGSWKTKPEQEQAFIEAWLEFAAWASASSGAGTLRLARDVRSRDRFVSFGRWDSIDSVRAWKTSPEFRERIGRVVQHVDEFEPTELVVAATADGGQTTVEQAPAEPVEPVHAG